MKQKQGSIRVGIDFGTTHTIVALADAGNFPVLSLPFEYNGEWLTRDYAPSCLTVYRDKLYFGPAATACFLDHFQQGAAFIPSIKRLLQDWYEGKTLTVGAFTGSVEELLTEFLSQLRRSIQRALDLDTGEIEAVIAVPANASSSQRYVTLACFRQAGFKVLRVLDEPVASGIQFVRERYKRWDRVEADIIIYDLGGGTFDTTLLFIRRDTFDPVLSRGISRLGGEDYDQALLELVEVRLGRPFTDLELPEMRQVVKEVKEGIGSYTRKLHIETPDGVVSIPINDFHEAVDGLTERTIDLVEKVMEETKAGAAPDRIVMVGGGSLLGSVQRSIRNRFGRAKIHQGLYPFASVAIGAAIQSDSPEVMVRDRLNNHFGVIRVREDGSEYVDVIFPKGMKLPPGGETAVEERPDYDPRYNIGRFRYLECDGVDPGTGRAEGEQVFWNEILFPYDRSLNPDGAMPDGLEAGWISATKKLRHERIRETFFLDEYGVITVRIARTVQDQYASRHNLFHR